MNSSWLSLSSDAALWGFAKELPASVMVMLFLASVVAVACFLGLLIVAMIPLGQYVGFFLERAQNAVSAYSVNLLGSLVGVWLPAALAFLWLPPAYWFALGFLLLLLVERPTRRLLVAGGMLLLVVLVVLRNPGADPVETYWSPYQKLHVGSRSGRECTIWVNNTGYMSIADLRPETLAHNPALAARYRAESAYDVPLRFARRSERVLVVGAGAGNDVAGALRNGAGRVDAVEIDPVIYRLGEQLHPEEPYRSPRVRVILDDARAFLRRTEEKYDVILFGLLDSHTQFSDLSNLRIDNYVYTEEAFREAQRRLQPDGVLIVKFEVRPPWTWMGQRFFAMLSRLFGRPPIAFYLPEVGHLASATVFISSADPDLWARAAQPPLATLIQNHPPPFAQTPRGAPTPTTDDWPYVYHRDRSVPRTYLTVSFILLVMAVLPVRRVLNLRGAETAHFFFLGAGFLLLETQMISRLALYFGSTWLVNCVVLTAILLVLVLANLYVARVEPRHLAPYYAILLLGLLLLYALPWSRLPYAAPAVGTLLSLAYACPLFCAGVIFTEAFRRSLERASAFGANIVGAVAGGLAQNLSFIVGLRALLLVAALFYAGAAVCRWRAGRKPLAAATAPSPAA